MTETTSEALAYYLMYPVVMPQCGCIDQVGIGLFSCLDQALAVRNSLLGRPGYVERPQLFQVTALSVQGSGLFSPGTLVYFVYQQTVRPCGCDIVTYVELFSREADARKAAEYWQARSEQGDVGSRWDVDVRRVGDIAWEDGFSLE